MRDLLTDPAWKPEDLGAPLPDSPHGVSVCIPTWRDVVDYEEGHPRVTEAFRSGYPRFFVQPRVEALFQAAARRFATGGECCLVFPTPEAAARCREFVRKRTDAVARLEPLPGGGAVAVVLPEESRKTARLFWRFGGETVSSRMAEHLLAALEGGESVVAEDGASRIIRERLAALAGVDAGDVFLFTSGMAAVFALHRALTAIHPGKPTVQLDFPYVDVLKVQEEFGGGGVKFFPVSDDAAIDEVNALAAAEGIGGVFCEMPSNPLLRCVRVSRFAPALKERGIPLIIDDTVAGVTNIDVLRHADAVTTSLTKAFSGVGDVLAGAVTLNPAGPHYTTLRRLLGESCPGNSLLWPGDAVALEMNSRDFAERSARMSISAAALAAWLEAHPAVEAVYYPRDGDGFEEVARPGGGRGCLLSFVLRNPAAAPAVYDALEVSKGPSLGTNFTLCCPYTLLAHYTELEWAARCGVRADLLRVSVGLEGMEELQARFARALALA